MPLFPGWIWYDINFNPGLRRRVLSHHSPSDHKFCVSRHAMIIYDKSIKQILRTTSHEWRIHRRKSTRVQDLAWLLPICDSFVFIVGCFVESMSIDGSPKELKCTITTDQRIIAKISSNHHMLQHLSKNYNINQRFTLLEGPPHIIFSQMIFHTDDLLTYPYERASIIVRGPNTLAIPPHPHPNARKLTFADPKCVL